MVFDAGVDTSQVLARVQEHGNWIDWDPSR
jgi:hypothetical protein